MNPDPSQSHADTFLKELELDITSDTAQVAAIRKQVEQLATEHGFCEQSVTDIGLCLNEALANIIRHAYSGQLQKPIRITVEFSAEAMADSDKNTPQQIRINLRDWGVGLHPAKTLPTGPRDVLQPGGLGLICLNKLMTTVTYTPQNDGMLLTLVKKNSRSTPN